MKKAMLITGLCLMSITFITSCGSEEKKEEKKENHEHEHADAYICPMGCEGEKTYAEAGSCPVCKMDLKKVEEHEHEHEGEHEH